MRTRIFCLLLLVTGGIMFAQSSATKSLSILVTPPPSSTGNLLTGMTPTNHTVPSGWTYFGGDSFDSTTSSGNCYTYAGGSQGAMGPSEFCFGGGSTTAHAHTGSKSWAGGVGTGALITLPAGHSEAYWTYYELDDAIGRFNDEMWIAHVKTTDGSNNFQEIILDYCCNTPSGQFNSTIAPLTPISQSNVAGDLCTATSAGCSKDFYQPMIAGLWDGAWHQWEFYYKPNTVSGGVANADGIWKVWLDGNLLSLSQVNVILNSKFNMSSGSMDVQVGGHYTKLTWLTNCSDTASCDALLVAHGPFVCSSAIGTGFGVNPDDAGSSYTILNQPCNPQLPNFGRYIDDFMVLYK